MTSATHLPGLVEGRAAGLRLYAGGTGQPVVLVHGLGGAASNWVLLSKPLSDSFRAIALELPGHGGSPMPTVGADIAWFADAAADALRELDVRRAIVVGHSFGGLVAVRLALGHPDLVGGLLLVSPAGIGSTTRVARAIVAATTALKPGRWVAPFRHRASSRVWFRALVFRPWFVSDARALSDVATRGFLAGPPEHLDTRIAGRAMGRDDPREELGRISCPSLVLWGARDAQLPLDDAFEFARRLGGEVRVIADCGHLAVGERPDAVLDGVRHLDVLMRDAEAVGEHGS